jgi:hypothetical protein
MAPRIPDAKWETLKTEIKGFYLDQDKTLEQTLEYLYTCHGFDAT